MEASCLAKRPLDEEIEGRVQAEEKDGERVEMGGESWCARGGGQPADARPWQ